MLGSSKDLQYDWLKGEMYHPAPGENMLSCHFALFLDLNLGVGVSLSLELHKPCIGQGTTVSLPCVCPLNPLDLIVQSFFS